jgi:multidrug efflux pump subunit AcrA (membrane-fusion protein)
MNQSQSIIVRFLIVVAIIVLGFMGLIFLKNSKVEPAKVDIAEQSLNVNVMPASFSDVPVSIEGYGQVRSKNVVSITPEIPGRIVALHPKLETGEIIPPNEVLFEIDPRDYQARLDEATSSLKQLSHSIERLKKQFKIDTRAL